MTLRKRDLAKLISKKTKISQTKTVATVQAISDVIIKNVSKGKKIALIGFGAFQAIKRPARNGRNPQNGVAIKIAAKTVPVFSAGKIFKEKVNKK